MKLFYQRTGALDSNKQQINVNQTINTMYAVPVSPFPPADLRKDNSVHAPSVQEEIQIEKPLVNNKSIKTIYPSTLMKK
jgi:hypothetical protein